MYGDEAEHDGCVRASTTTSVAYSCTTVAFREKGAKEKSLESVKPGFIGDGKEVQNYTMPIYIRSQSCMKGSQNCAVISWFLVLFTHCTLQSLTWLKYWKHGAQVNSNSNWHARLSNSSTIITWVIAVCNVWTGLKPLNDSTNSKWWSYPNMILHVVHVYNMRQVELVATEFTGTLKMHMNIITVFVIACS